MPEVGRGSVLQRRIEVAMPLEVLRAGAPFCSDALNAMRLAYRIVMTFMRYAMIMRYGMTEIDSSRYAFRLTAKVFCSSR